MRRRFPAGLLLALIVLLYTLLALYQLHLPGLHYDEAFEAVPALQLLQGQPVTTFRGHGLRLGAQLFPLMTQDYIGALNTYLALPFIAVLGPTPAALRLASVLVGAATLGLAYLLAGRLAGNRRAGLAAALLLAVDPTFIFWNRQGVFVTAITAALGLAAALYWLRWLPAGKTRPVFELVPSTGWALAGAFCWGLGLYAKFLFLWLIAAQVGAALLLGLVPLHRWRSLVLALPAFLLGCWPLLLYNLQTGGTWLSITGNAGTSYYGVNNLAFIANLVERLRQFVVLLSGGHLWYLGEIVANPLPPILFGLVLVLVLSSLVLTRGRLPAGPVREETSLSLYPFLVIGLVILASIATVSALWITHYALLMPWPAVALAVGGDYLARSPLWPGLLPPTRRRWLLLAGLGLLLVTQGAAVLRYHSALATSGGLSSHSDAIYDLSDWLAARPDPGPVVAMDWGLAAPVIYLTAGRVTPVEVFGYDWQANPQLLTTLDQTITQPATLYLWRTPDEVIFNRSSEFKALYRPRHLEETIEAAFYENSGRPLLGITRLVACGTPGIIPPDPSPYCP